MPVKRSRISKSMSEVDRLDCVSSRTESPRESRPVLPSAAEKSRKCLKPSTPENNQPLILSQESTYGGLGGFLECCYYCKRKIRQDDEVFMYSDLRAFCTAMCRDTQIAFDKEMEQQSAKSKVVSQGQQRRREQTGTASIATGESTIWYSLSSSLLQVSQFLPHTFYSTPFLA